MMNIAAYIAGLHDIAPEMKFAAALVADALEQAKRGDTLAAAWLAHSAPSWLSFVCPAGVDWQDVHAAILDQIPRHLRSKGISPLAMQTDLDFGEAA